MAGGGSISDSDMGLTRPTGSVCKSYTCAVILRISWPWLANRPVGPYQRIGGKSCELATRALLESTPIAIQSTRPRLTGRSIGSRLHREPASDLASDYLCPDSPRAWLLLNIDPILRVVGANRGFSQVSNIEGNGWC